MPAPRTPELNETSTAATSWRRTLALAQWISWPASTSTRAGLKSAKPIEMSAPSDGGPP